MGRFAALLVTRPAAVLMAFLLTLAPWTAPGADPGLFRGPYLTDVTPDAITVLWESATPSTGVVHYGVSSPDEHSTVSSEPSIHHQVRLTGLSDLAPPGSLFLYQAEVGGTRYSGQFHTAIEEQTPFAFLVCGDNRSSVTQHQAVVDAMLTDLGQARFLVNTGDMVSRGDSEADWDTFFTIEAPLLARLPVYLAIGNHEVHDDRWDLGQRIFEPPTELPPASHDEAFYHFVYGNAEFIVINTEVDTLYPGLLGTLAGNQERWLTNVLQQRPDGVDHRFLFIHVGPYSSKPGRTGNFWLRLWLDDLEEAGINLIVSGHDHYVERGFANNGIPYIIHGGGGAPLYETLGERVVADHTILFSETRLGYLLVKVDGPQVEVEIKGLSGEVLDGYRYGSLANPQCLTVEDCGPPPTNGCLEGQWECVDWACRYTCDASLISSLFTCFTDYECETVLGDQCPGTATCEQPGINPLEWHCLCDVEPQCTSDAACAGLPPPIPGCSGTWACMDEVCEFTPDELCAPDAGSPDLPPEPGEETGPSPEPQEDVGPGRDVEQTDAVSPGDDADGGTDDHPLPVVATPDEGCGCRTDPGYTSPCSLFLALLATLARRRSGRCCR